MDTVTGPDVSLYTNGPSLDVEDTEVRILVVVLEALVVTVVILVKEVTVVKVVTLVKLVTVATVQEGIHILDSI
jgi:hypothetical protein